MSVQDRPALTVVIAASDSAEAVSRCLESLGRSPAIEILVVAAIDRIAPISWSAPFRVALVACPPVSSICAEDWVAAPAGTGVPGLRRLGLDRARAPIVAFTEDSCRLAPGWADAWTVAFDAPTILAATGPVDHEGGEGATAWDWAVFFCEYAPFLGLAGRGPATRLAGNNFAVTARVARSLPGDDLHESALASEVARRGGRMVALDGAKVWHARGFSPREAIDDRLRTGLEFGRLRATRGRSPLVLLAGPAILLVQAVRIAFAPFASRRHRARCLEVLPITLALLAAWSVGEWLGWMSGPPRRARGCK